MCQKNFGPINVHSREIRLLETAFDFNLEEISLQLQKKLINLHCDDTMKGKFMKGTWLLSKSVFRGSLLVTVLRCLAQITSVLTKAGRDL